MTDVRCVRYDTCEICPMWSINFCLFYAIAKEKVQIQIQLVASFLLLIENSPLVI